MGRSNTDKLQKKSIDKNGINMKSLYVSQQGCYLSLKQESVIVKQKEQILAEVQLPLIEQILIFGKSQVTTQVIRTCLWRNIPIVYLSRLGYCYGRILPIERGYRQLARYQQQLGFVDRLLVAREIVKGKIKNSRVILQRQRRRLNSDTIAAAIQNLEYLIQKVEQADSIDKLMGYEGAAAVTYFSGFGESLTNPNFVFLARSRQPPGNQVNALLSFGYQVLWNHLLALIEIQGLDPHQACLHQGSERHAALASDLVEEFRAPIVDSLVLWLVNSKAIDAEEDFEHHNGGCYLNNSGRKKYLGAFLRRMEEAIENNDREQQPRWDLLTQQVKLFKQFVYDPSRLYQPFLIR
jgi:CRISP-associated protein Cas1